MPVSHETVAWAMRLLLGVEPGGADQLAFHAEAYDSIQALRTSFMQTPEAAALFEHAAGSRTGRRYAISPFLLRRPGLPGVPWRFEEPSLAHPVSQLCTAEQMSGPGYDALLHRLGLDHAPQARKVWEFVYILAALETKGRLRPGQRGLGFGTGHEPLPSAFAAAGCQVLATDAPSDGAMSEAWAAAGQWTAGPEELWLSGLLPRADFDERVAFRPVDMNAIPAELENFDFCWSACCLEHLGSIRHGLDFIHNSLRTLRPGGVAVHTTEFNLGSNDGTVELPELCLFRKRDIEQVIHELTTAGHQVEPLNLWPGVLPVDEHVDLPPYAPVHLKLSILDHTTTSIGLLITKAG